MSPYQRENSDPYRSERQPAGQPPQRANQPSAAGAQGGGHQGPPEQFRGQGSPQPGQQSPQPNQQSPQQGQPVPQQQGEQASQQGQQSPQQGRQPQQGVPQQRTPQQQAPQGVSRGTQGGQQPVQGGPMQAPAQGGGTPQGGPAAGTPRSPGMGGPGIQSAPIDEVLQSDVVTAGPDEPLAEIAERMATEDVGCVVVVEGEEPIGVVTDRSIALALRETPDLSEVTAGDLVAEGLVTGTTEMTVFDVLDRLEESSIRRLPIVDEDGALEGIVTLDDVVVLLGAELSDVSSIVQTQSPRF